MNGSAFLLLALTTLASGSTILGVLDYKGGFVRDLALAFKPTTVRQFELKVPAFCKDLEILDVTASVAGVSVRIDSEDPASRTFSVNRGAGSVLDTITVSMNGPADLKCAIPVRWSDGAAIPPSYVVGHIDRVHTKVVHFSNPHPRTAIRQINVENRGMWFFQIHDFIARSATAELKTTEWVTLQAGDRKIWKRPDGAPFYFDTLTLDIWHIAENVEITAVTAGAGEPDGD